MKCDHCTWKECSKKTKIDDQENAAVNVRSPAQENREKGEFSKSPQQIMGSLVKDYFTRRQNLSPDKIFHVIMAPCYDKKLEALREDVPTTLHSSQGADCMLTSGEIVQIIEQSDLASKAVDTLFGDMKEKEVRLHEGASSDGYQKHIFRQWPRSCSTKM
ncbi:Nuclear prelamin A recognition factor [Myotis davidii]|uniref:Nuclear prelamin A recognition factor n=1 Tax=Myotis davidii TaxID=225400 RepID=L5M4V5_MYODS|nr:Nuclear prelamin A recognition factor [Myotis davidii]